MKTPTYLKHDPNSRNDEKILKLHRKYPDGSGFGIYWMIIECLAESTDGRLKLSAIEDIAFGIHTSYERTTDVIQNFDLFKNDGEYFWSDRLCEHLEWLAKKSKMAKRAMQIRWHKEANIIRTYNERTTDGIAYKVKKSKVKESIVDSGEASSPTPAQKTKEFFEMVSEKGEKYNEFISQVSFARNVGVEIVRAEIDKFANYWQERNSSGTKERWQTEKTFEVQRRLDTWFSRSNRGDFRGSRASGGTIIS